MNWQVQLKRLLQEAEVRLSEISTEPLTAKAQAEIQSLRVSLARAVGIMNRNAKAVAEKAPRH